MLGWEPAEVTTYEYDGQGRLARAVTIREPEFSPWDVHALLLDREESLRPRGRHGIPMSEATDDANQFAFEARGPMADWAQKKLNEAEERYKKANPTADMDSLHFWIEKIG